MKRRELRPALERLEVRETPAIAAGHAQLVHAAGTFNFAVQVPSYNSSPSTSKAIVENVKVTNSAKLTGDFTVTTYWSDSRTLDSRASTIGAWSLKLTKTNPSGTFGYSYSAADLKAHLRPSWAKYLVARITTPTGGNADATTGDNINWRQI